MRLVMLRIKLNKKEYNYLCQATFINESCKNLLSSSQTDDDTYLITISEDQADEIRELCGEQLQVIGFDDKYELTLEGKILESLVDKFFVR
jgi:hypothetical protein